MQPQQNKKTITAFFSFPKTNILYVQYNTPSAKNEVIQNANTYICAHVFNNTINENRSFFMGTGFRRIYQMFLIFSVNLVRYANTFPPFPNILILHFMVNRALHINTSRATQYKEFHVTMSNQSPNKPSIINIDHKIKLCFTKLVVLKYTKVKKRCEMGCTWKSQMS